MTTPLLECVSLTKRFGDLTAVDSVDLAVYPGQVLGYAGPNGAGKTTTIRMMMGLTRPTEGRVRILGQDPFATPRVRRRVAYLPAELHLDSHLTVAQTLDFWARVRSDVDPAYRDELCQRLALDPSRTTRNLSTGNKRKIGLVGVFMGRPDLLILDEPTSGLDPLLQEEFQTMVNECMFRGQAVLLSSHILSEIEAVADSVAVIRAGQILARGPMSELLQRSDRHVRVRLNAPAVIPQSIKQLPGLQSAELLSSDVIDIVWRGPVKPLLQELVCLPVDSILAPEPNLGEAFMSFYSQGSGAMPAAETA